MLRPCSLVSKLDIPSGIWRADTYSSRAVAHSHSSVAKLSNSSDLEPPILLLEAKAVVLFPAEAEYVSFYCSRQRISGQVMLPGVLRK